jgi:hypothetical protein
MHIEKRNQAHLVILKISGRFFFSFFLLIIKIKSKNKNKINGSHSTQTFELKLRKSFRKTTKTQQNYKRKSSLFKWYREKRNLKNTLCFTLYNYYTKKSFENESQQALICCYSSIVRSIRA